MNEKQEVQNDKAIESSKKPEYKQIEEAIKGITRMVNISDRASIHHTAKFMVYARMFLVENNLAEKFTEWQLEKVK